MNIIKTLSIYFLCCCTIAYSGTIHDSVKQEKYKNYAKNVECVVMVIGTNNDNQVTSLFSGVMLKPRWMITAAHTIGHSDKYYVINNQQTIRYEIKEFIKNPEFNENKPGDGDLALAFLGSAYVIDFYPELYSSRDEMDKVCCFFGFGQTGKASNPVRVQDGCRRGGSNIIDQVEENILMCDMSRKKNTELEFCLSLGDSGGGMFINKKLAGINCCVFGKRGKPLSSYGDSSGFTRITTYRKWIEFIINE